MTLGTLYMGINGVTNVIEFSIPGLRVVSAANMREHWATRAARVRKERQNFALGVVAAGVGNQIREMPKLYRRIEVTMTRLAPRRLDRADNLPYSMKSFVDALAALLGVDDGSDRLLVHFDQTKGPYGLLVRLDGIG